MPYDKSHFPAHLKTSIERSEWEREKNAIRKVGKPLARRVLSIVDHGLSAGVGEPLLGRMCVEAAVCYAMGQEHGDRPSCVLHDVQCAKIVLNDMPWTSKKARAKGLRRLSVAQLGSDAIDHKEFQLRLVLALGRDILIPELMVMARKNKQEEFHKMLMSLMKDDDMAMWNKVRMEIPFMIVGPARNAFRNIVLYWESTQRVVGYMESWVLGGHNKLRRDERLTMIASCIEKALVQCKSKGRLYLKLCD